MFLEQLVNGLGQGAIYALMAIGYALIFGVVSLVTFAHGDVIMIGAFTAYYSFAKLSGSIFIAIGMGFLVSGLVGILIHRVCYNRFFQSPRQISLICTIGMGMFLRNFVQIFSGAESKPIPRFFSSGQIGIGIFKMSYIQVFIIITVLLFVVALTLLLNKTRIGLALRAVSMDKTASALLGISTKRITTLGNVLGCAIAGASGVLLAIYYGTISPTMGGNVGMKSFCVVILGGMSNMLGAAIGGLFLGIAENLGIMLFSAGFRDTISFLFLITILLIKPEGLFVRKDN